MNDLNRKRADAEAESKRLKAERDNLQAAWSDTTVSTSEEVVADNAEGT